MFRLTEVVKNLLFINIIVFVAKNLLPIISIYFDQYFVLFPFQSDLFSPVQIVTHMFNHLNFNHLLFNMISLIFIGPYLEQAIGPKKFLFLYLCAGIGGMLLQQFAGPGYDGMLGASGCTMGVLFGFGTYAPNAPLMLFLIPFPVKAMYLITGLVLLEVFMGAGATIDNTGHFAHLGGAIIGFALIMLWKKYPNFMA